MILDRTLPAVWQLRGCDVPALAPVTSRARTVVVDDVELLCGAIVIDVSRSGVPYAAREMWDLYEALAFMLGRTVEVLPKYDPTRGRRIHDPWTAGFKAWLHDELLRDLHDQWRSWYGRKGQKRLPFLQTDFLDSDGGTDDFRPGRDGHDGRSGRERRSRGALAEDQGDRGHVGRDVLRGLLEGGDREVLREVEALGLGQVGGVGGRVAGADRGRSVKVAA